MLRGVGDSRRRPSCLHGAQGLVVDYARGALYFQKACDLRNYEACWNLGLGYLNGDGVERDHDKAVALLEKGCTGGQARGCLNLGIAHHDDPGHTDPVKAFDAFVRSCELGDDEGCYRQARSLEHGDGTLRDTEAAAKLYKRAGHTLACSHTP